MARSRSRNRARGAALTRPSSTITTSGDGASMARTVSQMAATTRPAAPEADLLRTLNDGRKYELVDGEIRISPAGARHGHVCVRLVAAAWQFRGARSSGLRLRLAHRLWTSRGQRPLPDVTFVARGRFKGERVPEGFGDVVPDLAVKVLSPDDRARDVLDRVGEYLQAGVRVVWVVDPRRERAVAYRSLTDVTNTGPDDLLEAGEVVPGFRVKLRRIGIAAARAAAPGLRPARPPGTATRSAGSARPCPRTSRCRG